MFRGFIISPDPELAEELARAVSQAGCCISLLRKVERYPAEFDIIRLIRAHAPHIFLIDVSHPEEALQAAAHIEANAPGTQVVGFDRVCQHRVLLELMRAGIREFLCAPFELSEVRNALQRVKSILEQKPPSIESTNHVFAFLPAKAGVGCSTVALNASVAMGAVAPESRALLADFDLSCGIIGFMLRLTGPHSIVEAAERAAELDENLWPKLVSSLGQLDVLPTGSFAPNFRIDPVQIRHLMDFARRNYGVICVDLSGLMEKFSVDLMHEAKRVFLVCTPELPALHLAREKLDYLRSLDLEDRIQLVLNRASRRTPLSTKEIEKLAGIPVMMELPNDYQGVHTALTDGKPVNARSDLGRGFHELARRMLEKETGAPRRRRFVDYFSLVPAQYSFLPDGKKPG